MVNPSGEKVRLKDRSVCAESARSGVTISTRCPHERAISVAISAIRVLPALVGSATTKSSVRSVERCAAVICDGQSSTSDSLRAKSSPMKSRLSRAYALAPAGPSEGRVWCRLLDHRSSTRLRAMRLIQHNETALADLDSDNASLDFHGTRLA